MKPKVSIIQRRMTHYRVPLLENMRQMLDKKGIELCVLHGTPTEAECSKNDSGHLPWATELATSYLMGDKILWQPFMQHASGSDLIIVAQENKHIHNLPSIINPFRKHKLAFWGHGGNLQAENRTSLSEKFKRWTTGRVDWWFAYTDMSAGMVRATGFPSDRITVLNNSIDMSSLQRMIHTSRQQPLLEIRNRLGLSDGPVGLYIGSLYKEKRISFLIAASKKIRAVLPNFSLIMAGDGPERDMVRAECTQHDFIHWLGPVHGQLKADMLAVTDIMMNPGLVGLGILDAFAAALPIITTDCRIHSPEIAYLDNGINGLMTQDTMDDYVTACVSLLTNDVNRAAMKAHALSAASHFSIESMARNFSDGIELALRAT